jgi:hypothetical protein
MKVSDEKFYFDENGDVLFKYLYSTITMEYHVMKLKKSNFDDSDLLLDGDSR